ncbi:MAG: ABC transporter permease [Bryobacteraceae bacterium]|jgi:putative ABC transport system permease protein
MQRLRHLLATILGRSRMERDLAEELRFHIQSRAEHLMRSGLSAGEAERQARIEFGAVEAYKESCREASGLAWFDELRGNLRYTLRALRHNPGFTLAAVLSLAVGIGVNTSAFTGVRSMVLHPFPYPNLDRVMTVWESDVKLSSPRRRLAAGNFFDWKQNNRTFEYLAAYRGWNATLTGVDDPRRLQADQVSAGFFETFAMHPRLGRSFSEGDCEPGRDALVIVSDAFWKSQLASLPAPLGKTISLDSRTYTVIGVMPEDFEFPLATELWTPLALTPEEKSRRDRADLNVVARLKPGGSIGQARAEITALSAELERRYPRTNAGHGVVIKPLIESINEVTDRFSEILLAAATFVLLLACANVANLQLARSTARQREIGLRAALGASRFRIARELLTESIVIGILGGGTGVLLASWDVHITRAAIPAKVLQWVAGLRNYHLDGTAVAFGFALSVGAGVACSLPAVYQLLRQHGIGLNDVLKEGGRTSSSGTSRSRARSTLVVVEVALSLVLLIGAGLMVRTFQRMLTLNLGFDPKNVLIADVWLSEKNYRDDARMSRFFDQVLEGLSTVSGVEASAAAGDVGGAAALSIEGQAELRPGDPRPNISAISSGYFHTMRIPIRAGRSIGAEDGPNAPPVVVVSEAMARHYWPRSNPIGQRIRLKGPTSPWLTVAGVCGDLKNWFTGSPEPAVYVSYRQWPTPYMRLLLRTGQDPMQAASSVRAQVRMVDRNQAIYDINSEEQALADESSGVRMAAARMSIYAGISLLLAVMGCYAVGAFSVARRTQEIGIRMTLGAARGNILRMVLTQTARMTAIGLAAGLALAIAMTQIMSHELYNVVSIEPLTFVILTALLASSALLAGYIPAYRASHIDPMAALRSE